MIWAAHDLDAAIADGDRAEVVVKAADPQRAGTGWRLAGEAEALSEVQHSHVIRYLGIHSAHLPGTGAESDVLVLERAAGSLITAWKRGCPASTAGLYVEQICAGLAAIHSAGWVHADLKPANVLVARNGTVRLADFGLAGRLHNGSAMIRPYGSPDYMPPERRLAPISPEGIAIDEGADIWALGVLAHQLFTGQLPFRGQTPAARAAAATAYAMGRANLRAEPGLAIGWQEFIGDCLTADPWTRRTHDASSLYRRAQQLNTEHRVSSQAAPPALPHQRLGLSGQALASVARR